MTDNPNTLDALEDSGLISYTEEGLPVKTDSSRHLREVEVCCMILEYVVADIKVSNRSIARQTGIDPRSIGKYRSSDTFAKLLVEHTNKRMISVRFKAIERLEQMLADDSLNPNVMVKVIHESLAHSSKMAELALLAEREIKINVNDLIKELEDM